MNTLAVLQSNIQHSSIARVDNINKNHRPPVSQVHYNNHLKIKLTDPGHRPPKQYVTATELL